jgi:hypothetical protein
MDKKSETAKKSTLADNIHKATLEQKVAWYENALKAICQSEVKAHPRRTEYLMIPKRRPTIT